MDTANSETCIIKVLKPVAAKKINREIKILRNLTGGPNIVALLDVVQDPSSRYHSLIMEYVDNMEWKTLYPILGELDIKFYTFQLLKVGFIYATRDLLLTSSFPRGFGFCPFSRNHAS